MGLMFCGTAVWGEGQGPSLMSVSALVQWRTMGTDQPSTRVLPPPPAYPSHDAHYTGLSPAWGWGSPAVPCAAGIGQREERGQAPWSRGAGQGGWGH